MSSFDMSAPLRQSLLLTVGRPKQAGPAFTGMVRAFFGEKAYRAIDTDIARRPNAALYDSSGLYLAGRERALDLTARKERLMSSLVTKVPGMGWIVRASERAYVSYLNKIRADVFDAIAKELRAGGETPEKSPKTYEGLASYINIASGRAPLGPLKHIPGITGAAFFSPRFMAARLVSLNPYSYYKLPSKVRRAALRDAASVPGASLTIIALAEAGGADVEKDPRSTDFGKIRMGETRLEVWGGFQPWIRLLAEVATGQRKSLSGEIRELDDKPPARETRGTRIGRFVRGKLAPVPALVVDLLNANQDLVGRPVDRQHLIDTFTPMFLQDAHAVLKEHGLAGAPLLVPSFFGASVSTHERQERGATQ